MDVNKSFEAHWPIIQRKLIEKGFPLSRLNVEHYRQYAFREYSKNWHNKIVPELKRRRYAEEMAGDMYRYDAMRQAQANAKWRTHT